MKPRRRLLAVPSGSINWASVAAIAITLIALGLRGYAAGWGLPYTDNQDEPPVINVVLRMLQTGNPNPRFFVYPSLYLYLLLSVLSAHYQWGLRTGLYAGLDWTTVTTHLYTTIPGFFVWGAC